MSKSNDAKLDAVSLKEALWSTLQDVRSGKLTPGGGDAIASQAREILRTVRTQLQVFSQSGESVSDEVVRFAGPNLRNEAPAQEKKRPGPKVRRIA